LQDCRPVQGISDAFAGYRDGRAAARIIKAHIGQTEKRVLPALKRNAVIVEGRDA
jgi:hypothetical protein